jgi:hypothetical protein
MASTGFTSCARGMMDHGQAIQAAEERLAQLSSEIGEPLAIDRMATRRGSRGWLFFWNTRLPG